MSYFKVLEKSFIANQLREEGDIIAYDLPEGSEHGKNLEPCNPDGTAPAKRGRPAADA